MADQSVGGLASLLTQSRELLDKDDSVGAPRRFPLIKSRRAGTRGRRVCFEESRCVVLVYKLPRVLRVRSRTLTPIVVRVQKPPARKRTGVEWCAGGRGGGEEFSRKERRAQEAFPLSHLAEVDEAKRARKARTERDGERKVRAHDES